MMCQEFYDILQNKKIKSLYQPIVNLKNASVLGYEALSRGPMGSKYYSPLALIETALSEGCLWELELLFRQSALEGMHALPDNPFVFINVDPNVIKSPDYKTGITREYLKELGAEHVSLVFEITERTAIVDYASFQTLTDNYKSQGYLIAMDDVGSGYSGLKTMNEVRPNFVKIDMDLIRNIDKDVFKQALIRAFVDATSSTGIHLVAEGIETKEELKTLIFLGVEFGQGYFLKKPSDESFLLEGYVEEKIISYNKMAGNLNGYSQDYHYIGDLGVEESHDIYESMTKCNTIKRYFHQSQDQCVCICENKRPVGIVMKAKLDAAMSAQYGYALFSNKPIANLMNKKPLIVDAYTPISTVAKRAMERADSEIYDDVVVTKQGVFYSLVPMKKIIEYTLMYEKNNAREHNPLSGLPGNPIINRVLSDLVEYGTEVCVAYLDINDFKVYNDVLGFESGDQMICFVADLMKDLVKSSYSYSSFIGHIGGDDFVMVLSCSEEACHEICNTILTTFEAQKLQFFKADQIVKGSIVAEDRYGTTREFPLTSLSIAGIYGDLRGFETVKGLTERLAHLKKQVKKNGKSFFIIEKGPQNNLQ